MNYEIAVEGVALLVEVSSCINEPPRPWVRDSDWDFQGCRELEWQVVSGVTYDDDGIPMDVPAHYLQAIASVNAIAIEREIWFEIDNRGTRRRWAA